MKIRSLNQQFKYAIDTAVSIGTSKRADAPSERVERLYSIDRIETLRDFSRQFSRWMGDMHPEVRLVRDIQPTHAQEFLNSRASGWTDRTAVEAVSRLSKLSKLCEVTYHVKGFEKALIAPAGGRESSRTVAMRQEHIDMLRQSYAARDSQSAGRVALELTARCGLRAKECSRLSAENIDLEHKIIQIREGAKNGKYRGVPIRDKDMPFFAALKAQIPSGRVCPAEEDSLNRSIRNELKRCGLAEQYTGTTLHAVRKAYATERMEELRGVDRHDPREDPGEREAWETVQRELGHGSTLRMELYSTYVK